MGDANCTVVGRTAANDTARAPGARAAGVNTARAAGAAARQMRVRATALCIVAWMESCLV